MCATALYRGEYQIITPLSLQFSAPMNNSLSAEPKEKTSARSNSSALPRPQLWGQHLPLPPNTTTEVPRSFWVRHTARPLPFPSYSSFLPEGPSQPPPRPSPTPPCSLSSQGRCDSKGHVPQVRGGFSMKEGPEALMGGPPLSLSEGPAFSAFRLRPPAGMPPPLLRRMCPHCSPWPNGNRLTPVCPVKAFLQQLSLLWCFRNGVATAGSGWGLGNEERNGVL